MSLIDDELSRAEAQSVERRQQLAKTAVALQARLKPRALARDAGEELKEGGGDLARSGVEAVKRNPLTVVGVATAITAFLARKPLLRLFRRNPNKARKD